MSMKKGTLIAAVVTPIVAASTGFMIARTTNASADDASGYCTQPTVYIDMVGSVSMVSGRPNANANCEGDVCTVAGVEQVEVNADGRVQCVNVDEGQSLSLTRRSDGLSLLVEDVAVR
jgi:hypothetical protein